MSFDLPIVSARPAAPAAQPREIASVEQPGAAAHRDWDAELNWVQKGSLNTLKELAGALDDNKWEKATHAGTLFQKRPAVSGTRAIEVVDLNPSPATKAKATTLSAMASFTKGFLQESRGHGRVEYDEAAAVGPNWIYLMDGKLVACASAHGTAVFANEDERMIMVNAVFTHLKRQYNVTDSPPEFRKFLKRYFNRII